MTKRATTTVSRCMAVRVEEQHHNFVLWKSFFTGGDGLSSSQNITSKKDVPKDGPKDVPPSSLVLKDNDTFISALRNAITHLWTMKSGKKTFFYYLKKERAFEAATFRVGFPELLSNQANFSFALDLLSCCWQLPLAQSNKRVFTAIDWMFSFGSSSEDTT